VGLTHEVLEIAFLTQLGHALSAAGDPVSSTERTLKRVADKYGMSDIEIAVLPTLVLVRGRSGDSPTMDLAGSGVGDDLRLDQIGALYDIVDETRHGCLSAVDGLARIADVWRMPARFGAAVRIGGHVILTVGLGLILTPRLPELLWCALLGLLVGVLIECGRRWSSLDVLLPVVASGLVSAVSSCRGVAVRPTCTALGLRLSTSDHLPHAERWHSSMMMWVK